MAEPVLCKSTRYGEGCGHPVNDHVGEGPCCCCNGQQNSTEHVADCARCWVVHYKWRHPEPITAGDLAAVMPEHLSRSFWRLAVERYMRENLPPAAPALPKEGDSE